MKALPAAIYLSALLLTGFAFADDATEEANKAIALGFYENLWGSPNTDRYAEFMADTYIAHDIGSRKGVTEPAIEQKRIADRFWNNGTMHFELDYQVAEGDLVATRWWWGYEPETLLGHIMFGSERIPIINVFRIRDGKIVELWNHRHDIDTRMASLPILLAFITGLVLAGIPALIYRKKARRAHRS